MIPRPTSLTGTGLRVQRLAALDRRPRKRRSIRILPCRNRRLRWGDTPETQRTEQLQFGQRVGIWSAITRTREQSRKKEG